MAGSPRRWFDAHLDLACLAENGRDMTRPPAEAGGPWLPGSVTFPSLREGGVEAFLGTIFTEADGKDAVGYPAGDAEEASRRGWFQLSRYMEWYRHRNINLMKPPAAGTREKPRNHLYFPSTEGRFPEALADAPKCFILMEGADPIKEPRDLEGWVNMGVWAIGLTWARGSRYAAGNSSPAVTGEKGLTALGREMIAAMDDLGVVHDLSHLSQRATEEVLGLAKGRVIASHSNCRELIGGEQNPFWQRHLADGTIREIARRGGVIGLNLFAPFLAPGYSLEPGFNEANAPRPSVEEALRHVERVCELAGHTRAVGLGSDMDGGFSSRRLPAGIDGPRDLGRLTDALLARGWSEEGVDAFAWGNWARFFGLG